MSQAGISATKLTLIFVNFLFMGLGIACMIIGGWVLLDREEVRVLTLLGVATNNFGLLQNAAILITTSGLALAALSFMGCFAIYRERKCLQVLYIGLVGLACVVTVSACVLSFLFRKQVEEKLLSLLSSKLKTDYQGFTTSRNDFLQPFGYTQVEFECCGVLSYEEYKGAMNWTVQASSLVPLTCCRLSDKKAYLKDKFLILEDVTCALSPNSNNSHIDRPCYTELKNWMEEEGLLIGCVAIATIVLQVLAIFFMTILMRRKTKGSDQFYRDTLSSNN